MPAYPVGMVLLVRLAAHRRHQGQAHRALLLAEALRKAIAAGEAAARLVVVDAVDDQAEAFYARHGSSLRPDTPCASTGG